MMHLRITVRWLDNRCHGLLGRDGPPEWPPSPYRLFQALVAGAARAGKLDEFGGALKWLETLSPPAITTPPARAGQPVTHFVPNNDGDKKPDRQGRLTSKTRRPTIMLGEPAVHYVWPISSPVPAGVHEMVRYLVCLGLGIDMAYADCAVTDDTSIGQLGGIRWLPKESSRGNGQMLRIPISGTLTDLEASHQSRLNRADGDKIRRVVRRPGVFGQAAYTSTERPLGLPCEFFVLRGTDGEFFPYPQAKLIHIAGMVRHAAITAMDIASGYPPPGIPDPAKWVETFIAGHRGGNGDHQQFSYVPLPSIGHEHADCDIRRVMIVAPFGEETNLAHLAEQLDDMPLQRKGGGEAPILHRLRSDGVTAQYTRQSTAWTTVTPIILPGHDDHKPAKTRKLLLAALERSGIEQPCEFTWSAVPNFKNGLSAYSHDRQGRHVGYFRPDHLHGLTAVHARLRFEHPVPGPLVVGAGRHCGFGLLAAVDH